MTISTLWNDIIRAFVRFDEKIGDFFLITLISVSVVSDIDEEDEPSSKKPKVEEDKDA